jgi:RND superfamily putative drug exporter
MRAAGQPAPDEPPTTRFAAPQNASPERDRPATPAAPQPGAQPARGEDREIESWLSELRGPQQTEPTERPGATTPSEPSADETRAIPVPGQRVSNQRPTGEDDATTAIPTPPRDEQDPEVATQKLNARGKDADNGDRSRQRRGGGLSAQDLLRREGRI